MIMPISTSTAGQYCYTNFKTSGKPKNLLDEEVVPYEGSIAKMRRKYNLLLLIQSALILLLVIRARK